MKTKSIATVVLIGLVAALAVGVGVVQKKQEIRSKAQTVSSQPQPFSDFPCQYSMGITQPNPQDPNLFAFKSPWEIQTPVRMDGILAGSFSDFAAGNVNNLTIIRGPLSWVPDTIKDWDHTERFTYLPEVVAIGLTSYVRMENGQEVNEIRYGCSLWRKPTTLASPCPPSLISPFDSGELASTLVLTWGSCANIRAAQFSLVGGINHPINFVSEPMIVTSYFLDPNFFLLDNGARYAWRVRACFGINDGRDGTCTNPSPWSFPWTFYKGTRTKSPAIGSCPFSIGVFRDLVDPAKFTFTVPSDKVVSTRIDGVGGSRFDLTNPMIVFGPLPWYKTNGTSTYSKTFQYAPDLVAAGMVTWSGVHDINYGCSLWRAAPSPTLTATLSPTNTPVPTTPIPTATPAPTWTPTPIVTRTPTPTPITLSRRVVGGSDDAEERISDKVVSLGSSDLELGNDGSTAQIVGIRFRSVTIPKGKTIVSAYIEFQVDEVDTKTTTVSFYGHKTANSAAFSTSSGNLSSRTKTTAKVTWSSIPSWTTVGAKYKSPDLKSIVQEIVNQSGWISGNALTILVSGSGERTAESYQGLSSAAPRVVMKYR